jgi:hypothetical protein
MQALKNVMDHFRTQIDAGSKLSGCVHCAGVALKSVGLLPLPHTSLLSFHELSSFAL